MTTALSRSFNNLVASTLAAQSAEQLSLAAVPIVAVLLLDAGPGEIGALATAQTLPFLLLAIPLGLWADRSSRRRLMVLAELLRALSLMGLLAAVLSGTLSLPLLALLGFAGAVGTVGYSVAAPALLPSLVPAAALAQANSRLELARSAAFAAGPALAGALVSFAGASSAFVLAACLSAAAVALLLRLHEPARPPEGRIPKRAARRSHDEPARPPEGRIPQSAARRLPDMPARAPAAQRHPWIELREGARLVWLHPLLRPILLTSIAWNIAWFVLQAVYVPYAMRALSLDAGAVGLTLASYGAGMVAGALLARRIVARLSFGHAILLGPLVSVGAAATMVATLLWPRGALAAMSFFLFGFGPIVWTITSTTLRQTVTPQAMLGCVSAMFLTVNMGARPLGAALGGLVGARWGDSACLWLALAGFALQAGVIVASQVRTLRGLPAAAGA